MQKLVEYESSSESEDEAKLSEKKHEALPLPAQVKNLFQKKVLEDKSKHGERIRGFEHVEGNWACFVYIDAGNLGNTKIIGKYLEQHQIKDWNLNEEFHISLSKTFAVPFHSIQPMVQLLKEQLKTKKLLELSLFDCNVKCYTNDEKTRTFIGLEFGQIYRAILLSLVERVNTVVTQFGCDTYYEESSFHTSLLWTVGDKSHDQQTNKMKDYICSELESLIEENFYKINKIYCKAGNRLFQLPLS